MSYYGTSRKSHAAFIGRISREMFNNVCTSYLDRSTERKERHLQCKSMKQRQQQQQQHQIPAETHPAQTKLAPTRLTTNAYPRTKRPQTLQAHKAQRNQTPKALLTTQSYCPIPILRPRPMPETPKVLQRLHPQPPQSQIIIVNALRCGTLFACRT